MSSNFDNVQIMKDLKGYLSSDDVRKLIEHGDFGPKSVRNILLIKTLAYTGRRVSEIVGLRKYVNHKTVYTGGLKPKDIDQERCMILWNIVKKRSPKQAWIPAQPEIINNLIMYVNKNDIKEDEIIFPISRERVFQLVRYAGKLANLNMVGNKKIHPHVLRHSLAVSLIQNDTPIFEIKKILDHSSILVTEGYLKISPEDIRKSINKVSEIYKKKEVVKE